MVEFLKEDIQTEHHVTVQKKQLASTQEPTDLVLRDEAAATREKALLRRERPRSVQAQAQAHKKCSCVHCPNDGADGLSPLFVTVL